MSNPLDALLDDPMIQARVSPAGWMKLCRPRHFQVPPHVDYINRRLRAAVGHGGARIKLELPPRHGKTWLANTGLGAWYLGKFPDREVATCSVSANLGAKNATRSRADMRQCGGRVFGLELDPERDAKVDWGVRRIGEARPTEGGFRAYGVGSQIHGDGAHLGVLDDLLGGSKAARSQVQKDAVWDWVVEDFMSRTYPESDIVSIMTRWAEDDPHGRMETDMPDEGWVTIRLPAIAEEGDVLGRAPGEALWEAKRPLWWLKQRQAAVTARAWNSTYQQRPAAQEGDIWKAAWWESCRYTHATTINGDPAYELDGGAYTVPHSSLQVFTVVDLAFSEKTSADYTVIGTFAITPERPGRMLVLDMHRERMPLNRLWPTLRKLMDRWDSPMVYMERDGQQIGIVQQARAFGFPVKTIGNTAEDDLKKHGDKEATAHAATPLAAGSRLWVPSPGRQASWLPAWQSEMLTFPNSAHKDQEDVTAWACLICLDRTGRMGGVPDIGEFEPSRAAWEGVIGEDRGGVRGLM